MTKRGKLAKKLAKWLDECRLAASGLVLATKDPRFMLAALLTFIIFGALLNLLMGGLASFNLLAAADLPGKLKILWQSVLAIFGVGRAFWDWALTFSITVLQSVLVGLLAVVWKKSKDAAGLQNTGLVAGLAVLGSGCPTCGTTLLTPVIGLVFSGSGYAIAGLVSGLVTTAAVIIALLTLKKLGLEAYVMIVSERFKKRKANNPHA